MSQIIQPIHLPLFTKDGEFYLYAEQDLAALGDKQVRIGVQMHPDVADFAHIPLPQRRAAIDAWSKATYDRVTAAVPMQIIKSRIEQDYRSFTCELAAANVPRLLREPGVSSAHLVDTMGLDSRQVKKIKRRSHLEWYAVQARFAIQIEDDTTGLQSYEDRIVLVKAWNFDDAVKRLEPKFADYAAPYFNSDWQLVRWQFERILDVYRTDEERFDPHGTEVFSQMKHRRMRPEYEWHPLQQPPIAGASTDPIITD